MGPDSYYLQCHKMRARVCSVQCAVCSVQCAVCSVQYTADLRELCRCEENRSGGQPQMEVRRRGLAELVGRGYEVQQIVDQLEGDTQVLAVLEGVLHLQAEFRQGLGAFEAPILPRIPRGLAASNTPSKAPALWTVLCSRGVQDIASAIY